MAPKAAPRAGEQLIADLLAAPDEQAVVPGSAAAEKVLPRLATALAQVLAHHWSRLRFVIACLRWDSSSMPDYAGWQLVEMGRTLGPWN